MAASSSQEIPELAFPSELIKLAADMESQLAIDGSFTCKLDVGRHISHCLRLAAAKLENGDAKVKEANEKSEDARKKFRDLTAKIQLGDYAGLVYNDIKSTGKLAPSLDKLDAIRMDAALKQCDTAPKGSTAQLASFNTAVSHLPGLAPMPESTARFAIQAYGIRNKACHSKSAEHKTQKNWPDLVGRISSDLDSLPALLPDSRQTDLDHWRLIIAYYRARYISEDKDDPLARQEVPKAKPLPHTTAGRSKAVVQKPSRSIYVTELPPEGANRFFNNGMGRDAVEQLRPTPVERRDLARTDPVDNTQVMKRKADVFATSSPMPKKAPRLGPVDLALDISSWSSADEVAVHARRELNAVIDVHQGKFPGKCPKDFQTLAKELEKLASANAAAQDKLGKRKNQRSEPGSINLPLRRKDPGAKRGTDQSS